MDRKQVEQHTEGPWRWENHPCPDGKPYITIEGGKEPFGFNGFPHGLRVTAIMSEADARLIAAGPTMYDYVAKQAAAGDPEASKILESIHAAR